jgi:hypothetical protein
MLINIALAFYGAVTTPEEWRWLTFLLVGITGIVVGTLEKNKK